MDENIPLVDLKAQYRAIKREIDAALSRILDSAQFIMGKEVSTFEEEFARFCEARFAVGTSSGTSALQLALSACGVSQGDEVITTGFTFIATAEAISCLGATPVFVDVVAGTLNLDPLQIERAITPRTTAILPVHIYGHPADMGPILDIAEKHGLKVIEDAAQAHGARYQGKRVGGLGDAGCFSFFPAKNLGAYGDGGAVVTNDPQVAERVALLRDHGRKTKYEHTIPGYNHRLDALQAAVLRVKLRYLEVWSDLRRQHAERYHSLLEHLPLGFSRPAPGTESVYHLFAIMTQRREELQQRLREQGIETGIHYPIPVHLQPAYDYLGYRRGDLPVTEKASEEVLSLPMYPELSPAQLERVAEVVSQVYSVFSPQAAR